jgi:hypothetical protein
MHELTEWEKHEEQIGEKNVQDQHERVPGECYVNGYHRPQEHEAGKVFTVVLDG